MGEYLRHSWDAGRRASSRVHGYCAGMHRSKWSIASEGSLLSIASRGSVLSIGSVGSALSIGSVGSVASAFSIGSAASAGSLMSWLSLGSTMSAHSTGGTMTFGVSRESAVPIALIVGAAALGLSLYTARHQLRPSLAG